MLLRAVEAIQPYLMHRQGGRCASLIQPISRYESTDVGLHSPISRALGNSHGGNIHSEAPNRRRTCLLGWLSIRTQPGGAGSELDESTQW